MEKGCAWAEASGGAGVVAGVLVLGKVLKHGTLGHESCCGMGMVGLVPLVLVGFGSVSEPF